MQDQALLMGTAPIPRLILRFALPSMVGLLANALYNIVDRIFIGHYVGADGLASISIVFPLVLLIVAFASMINALGEVATAAHTIANTVESAFYIPGYAMQTAAATLTGNAYGARDRERMRSLSAMLIPIEIGLMIVSGGLLFAFAPVLMRLFLRSADVITLGATVLRMVAVSEPFYGFSIIVEGMMQGVGRTREPFLFNIAGMWLVRIVGTFLCTRLLGLGLVSAWGCMIAHNLLLFGLYLLCYVRGTWNPLQTAD